MLHMSGQEARMIPMRQSIFAVFASLILATSILIPSVSADAYQSTQDRYESAMGDLITAAVLVVILIIVMVAVTIVYKRRVLDPMKPASGGFMAGVNDDVHGGHAEGKDIVLSRSLGGGRFPAVELDEDSIGAVPSGSFRIVLQPATAGGKPRGEPLISSSDTSADLVRDILSLEGASGTLSVYTPDREDARSAMEAAIGLEPTEYGFSAGILSKDLRNFRRCGGKAVSGPMCLFGRVLPAEGDEARDRMMDQSMGFHIVGDRVVRLSEDLGGIEAEMRDIGADSFEDAVLRSFHLLVDLKGVSKVAGKVAEGAMMSVDPIPYRVALAVCANTSRTGVLSVYTPDRADAERLMREASGGEDPYEARNPRTMLSFDAACLVRRSAMSDSPKAVYGPMRGAASGSDDA